MPKEKEKEKEKVALRMNGGSVQPGTGKSKKVWEEYPTHYAKRRTSGGATTRDKTRS